MVTRSFIKVLLLTLLCSCSLSACGGKDDPNPQKKDQQELIIADLKIELEIEASEDVTMSVIAAKGFEPNIYRDGKLVSQGNYTSEKEKVRRIKTTLEHRGQALVCDISFERVSDSENPITISIKGKLFQGGKLLQEYNTSRELKKDIISEQFSLYSKK